MSGAAAAIFDLDGTLADSLGVWSRIDRMFFEKHGLVLPGDYEAAIKNMGYARAAAYTKSRFFLPQSEDEISAEWRAMAAHEYACDIELKAGAGDYLRTLSESGVRIGLATVSGRDLYEPFLRRHGILRYFDACVTTAEAGRDKEFPDVYLLCAQKLNVPAKACVVFEDILVGVRSAKAAGMRAVGVYDSRSASDRENMGVECDRYIEDFYHAPKLMPL